MYLSVTLKIAFSNFLSEKEAFQHVALHSLHFLVALNTALVFLEALN